MSQEESPLSDLNQVALCGGGREEAMRVFFYHVE